MSRIPDHTFEHMLRGVLEDRRPSHDATQELRVRVDSIPDEVPRSGRVERVRPAVSLAAGVAGLAAAAIIAIFLFGTFALRPETATVGASPDPAAPGATFDPSIEGPGIITRPQAALTSPPVEALTLVPWAIALATGSLLVWVAVSRGGLRRILAIGGIVAIVAGAWAWSSHPGFELGHGWGPIVGIGVQAETPPASDGPEVWYVTAEPDGPVGVTLVVRNPGPLPITLLGVVEERGPSPFIPHWNAVWIYEDRRGAMPGVQDARPFRQVEVPSEGWLILYLVGNATDCVFGPSFTLADAETVGFTVRSEVQIAYSVLGVPSVGTVELPFLLAEPLREDCPAGA